MEYMSIGQIVNVHGVKGEIKVYPLTDDMERFSKVKEFYVEQGPEVVLYEVESVKYLKNTVIIKVAGIDTVEVAKKLIDKYVQIDRKKAVKLPQDSFFVCDLIDMQVYKVDGTLLGTIQDVIETGSNDVYVVKGAEKEILIPGLKSIVKSINTEEKKMIVDLLEGLE